MAEQTATLALMSCDILRALRVLGFASVRVIEHRAHWSEAIVPRAAGRWKRVWILREVPS